MVRWNSQVVNGLFLVAFPLDEVKHLLKMGHSYQQSLVVLNRKIADMVELTSMSEAVPEHLHFLSAEENQAIQYRQPVINTHWEVASLPEVGVFATYSKYVWGQSVIIFTGFFMLGLFMTSLAARAAFLQDQTQAALRTSTRPHVGKKKG